MNFVELFKTQEELDQHITKNHPVQENENRLIKKILAFQVELGELANEWRGFKFWSTNQTARTLFERKCHVCRGEGKVKVSIFPAILHEPCGYCDSTGYEEKRNPLLEEFADCFAFTLSIGLEIGIKLEESNISKSKPIENQFVELISAVQLLTFEKTDKLHIYKSIVEGLLRLALDLGFTLNQIEAAYYEKNIINHKRQEESY